VRLPQVPSQAGEKEEGEKVNIERTLLLIQKHWEESPRGSMPHLEQQFRGGLSLWDTYGPFSPFFPGGSPMTKFGAPATEARARISELRTISPEDFGAREKRKIDGSRKKKDFGVDEKRNEVASMRIVQVRPQLSNNGPHTNSRPDKHDELRYGRNFLSVLRTCVSPLRKHKIYKRHKNWSYKDFEIVGKQKCQEKINSYSAERTFRPQLTTNCGGEK
jgi:hypothetical protein